MNAPILVREMTFDDCDRVSEIRIRGWQHAYKGLMPQTYLDALSVPEDAERRRTFFVRAGSEVVNLVAEQSGTVIGWACHGPYRDGEIRTDDAELYAIYVDAERFGAGIGRALLGEAVRRCAGAGHRRLLLWVVEGNDRARRFYERAGFTADGAEEPFEVDGVAVPEVRYVRELRG
ncbi:N-acetyltransferase family protein [Streptomyces turgidiscabies]|uniref:Acetyltransferase, GNAT family n=1 Tax=Streptomyces turgidiscabies (strain Car8) TaxID=698760 RepID=L7F7G3_STRT8|nr:MULTISPECIES: GNAT family N-acetyltransferase [Streptomyces]ELP67543.1 acetyltransferase, GNAT family [Streptomyces turgidiscabies Car8]MDX3491189.1 GNAT family N-acetyltransferase [Streptomyces turgidiscabies]GAQ73042.1 putative acetyltransferase [Streptomyces turgidiscabies]